MSACNLRDLTWQWDDDAFALDTIRWDLGYYETFGPNEREVAERWAWDLLLPEPDAVEPRQLRFSDRRDVLFHPLLLARRPRGTLWCLRGWYHLSAYRGKLRRKKATWLQDRRYAIPVVDVPDKETETTLHRVLNNEFAVEPVDVRAIERPDWYRDRPADYAEPQHGTVQEFVGTGRPSWRIVLSPRHDGSYVCLKGWHHLQQAWSEPRYAELVGRPWEATVWTVPEEVQVLVHEVLTMPLRSIPRDVHDGRLVWPS